jgi:feruloyl esterase
VQNLIRVAMAFLLAATVTTTAAPATDVACEALKAASFDHTTIVSTTMTPADAAASTPAFCEVTATISPVPGSRIGVVYRLPENWNGKMLGLGGGGWAGNVQLARAMQGLKNGYATAQTDAGHPIPATAPDVWRPDKWGTPETFADFSYRAIHEMTAVAKAVVAKYYGKPQTNAYFHGCSTGGRQALMEVQRYPDDYDGVVSMAPVLSLTVQTSSAVRANTLGTPGAALTPELLSTVHTAVLKSCDAQDGLADGLLDDPRQCSWDPAELLCTVGQAGNECLAQPQVDALRTLYNGVRTSGGRVVAWPLARGDESSWRGLLALSGPASDTTNAGGLGALTGPVFGDPNFNLATFDPSRHYDVVAKSAFAKDYEANDPNIATFTKRGGKLLLWHGWADPGPSPWLTIDYYERVLKATPNVGSSVRLFMAPAVGHCAGGRGPDQFDALTAIDTWVTTGAAPDELLATKAKPPMTRPLCAYPKVAKYKGSGNVNDAASFVCK